MAPSPMAVTSAQIVGAVDAGLGRKAPAVLVLDVLVDLELEHDRVETNLGYVEANLGFALDEIRLELGRIEVLTRNDANACKLGD